MSLKFIMLFKNGLRRAVLRDDGMRLVEMGKHSWGHSPGGSSAQRSPSDIY